MTTSAAPKLSPQEIAHLINEMGCVHFLPNKGNYGDLLIAEGIRDFFAANGIEYQELAPGAIPLSYNLVYGGGGIFVKQWISRLDTGLITGPQVKKCILLPCSIREVDDFVDKLDDRHTVLCRELQTYLYCTGRNKRARFYLADDMALQADAGAILKGELTPETHTPWGKADQENAAHLLGKRFAGKVAGVVKRSTVTVPIGGKRRRVAFVLRTDTENVSELASPGFTDISIMYHTRCYAQRYNKRMLQAMALALGTADVVVSNRLHVCLMAHLIGKEVHMLDNDYGKLRGVYELSLSGCTNVHYVGTGILPPELQKAYAKLNGRYCRLRYLLAEHVQSARHRVGTLLHELHLR